MSDRSRARDEHIQTLSKAYGAAIKTVQAQRPLVPLQVTRDLEHLGSTRLDRTFTNPSPSLQKRYTAALHSNKEPSTDYRPEQAYRRQPLREEDLRRVEKRPKIRVRTSSHSLSIIIPEGVKLPLVAAIHSAGSFDTQMSDTIREEETNSTPRGTPRPGRRQRRATISAQSSDTVTRDSEGQDISVGLGLPFLATVSKGRLNVSEASIPAPKSSDISAQGQVFTPTHEHPEKRELANTATAQADPTELVDPAAPAAAVHDDSEHEATPGKEGDEEINSPSTGLAGFVTKPSAKSETALDQIRATLPELAPFDSSALPEIRVHRPSGTIMATPLGASAANSVGVPATPATSAVGETPAGAATAPLDGITKMPPTTGLPVDLASVTNAVPMDPTALNLPVTGLPNIPGVPLGGKVGKRRKVVRKARKVVVRKQLLRLILGRELANVVQPLLKQTTSGVAGAPLPVDGASDLSSVHSVRNERKRDMRRKQLDRMIYIAKIYAATEELEKCPTCRGLITTRHIRKCRRLELERDRPGMKIIDRHAAAWAKVAQVQCRCPKRLTARAEGAGSIGDV
ncbi:hypothetical protein LTR96_003190 [Exophiala xenobiotica]|nr:hypothetical protein LTR96_003190 [Exophiala xenobiotica]KAK5342601.1 hypothetical protein LTR98_000226 [Exophiala xenobiotica]